MTVQQAGHISQTGLCPPCSERAFVDNLVQLKTHRGPRFHYWRRRIAASVGGVIVDDLPEPD